MKAIGVHLFQRSFLKFFSCTLILVLKSLILLHFGFIIMDFVFRERVFLFLILVFFLFLIYLFSKIIEKLYKVLVFFLISNAEMHGKF